MNQDEYFEGTVHSANIANYKIVRKNQFAYNPSRVNVGSIDILKDYEEGALSPMYVVFEVDTSKLLPDYFKYYFQTNRFYENVKNNTQGSVRNSLSFKALSDFEYLLPPIEKQEKIVNILKTIDSIIEKYESLLEEKNQFIKSQFVEMFGNPKVNDKNWIKAPMGDYMTILTDFSSNGSYKTLDSTVVMYDKPNYAYMVRTTDLENEDYKNNVKYITEEAYNFLAKSKVYPDDIIMNKIGSAGKVYIMPDVGMPVSLGRNAFLFRYNNYIVPVFMYYLLKSEYGMNEISQYVRGAVTKTITKNDVRKVKIIVPPIELQNKFADFVKVIDKQKIKLEKQITNYKTLKKG